MSAIKMKRVLTTPALIAFGLAYMVPLGIFTTYGQVTVISNGHLPVAEQGAGGFCLKPSVARAPYRLYCTTAIKAKPIAPNHIKI